MSRRVPMVSSADAVRFLQLTDYVVASEPAHPFEFLRGWLSRAVGEPLVDPRAEPGESHTIGKVEIVRRKGE